MEIIEFAHANGFPAQSYRFLFQKLPEFQFSYVKMFGHANYSAEKSWWPLVHELIEHIEANHTKPIVGVGHSLGAYLFFFAAGIRPDLFSRIILLDPPMFPFHKRAVIAMLVKFRLLHKVPHPANKAKVRKHIFSSVDEAREYFKGKALFKNFHETCFEDYLHFGLSKVNDNYTLTFNRDVEYKIFKSMPVWLGNIPKSTPIDYIYSAKWEVLTEKEVSRLKSHFPHIRFHAFNGGHLFPFEKPDETAALLRSIILS